MAYANPQAKLKTLDNIRIKALLPRRLALYKDAGRSLRLAERERFPRAGARHLRSRAASGQRPAGITTGLRVDRWTGIGGGGSRPSFSFVPGSASGAEWRRWFAATRAAVERR
jgi:hypothetical protein